MAQFAFELVSPERRLIAAQVDAVIVPGTEGEFTVLAGHAPFMSTLKPGIISVEADGKTDRVMVYGGFAEVNPDGLTILAEKAINLADVDREALQREIDALTEALKDAVDYEARNDMQAQIDQLTSLAKNLVV